MKSDVQGRVQNTHLARGAALLPFFEAVINGIHAAAERAVRPVIDVRIERDPEQSNIEDGRHVPAVVGFSITDNGIGFTDENYESFDTADSRHKANQGGKGVGRFLWLKAFSEAVVESTYSVDGELAGRRFTFGMSGVANLESDKPYLDDIGTRVTLKGFVKFYADAQGIPRGTEPIARRLLEHCLEYYLDESPPDITVRDDHEIVKLQELFSGQYRRLPDRELTVNASTLTLSSLRAPSGGEHEGHICAHRRVVRTEKLKSRVRNLDGPLVDPDTSEPFTFIVYVSGGILDGTVNAERTMFNVPDSPAPLLDGEFNWRDFFDRLATDLKEYLAPYTAQVRKQKRAKLESYIDAIAPENRILLKYREEELEAIPLDASHERLSIDLYKIRQDYKVELRRRGGEIMEKVANARSFDEYRDIFDNFMQDWNELGKSELVEYVIHRKSVLAFLEKMLGLQEDGKYSKEDRVHSILFPMRTESDDVDYEDQNLWIIDERLAFHRYLASDLALQQLKIVDVEGNKRPDIVVFDAPAAFTNEEDPPFGSVVILELKRPMRDDYQEGESKNPVDQVYGYVSRIRRGDAKDGRGRPIGVLKETPFYCYILADLTESLRRQAENAGLTLAPDRQGYFGYNANHRAYVEIIGLEKMLTDAKKRNRVLFRKLKLPD